MNVKRLTILRNFLATEVPEGDYSQRAFGVFDNEKLTFACAGGWATQIPALQELGLKNEAAVFPGGGHMVWPIFEEVEFGGSPALQKFFDLTDDEYDYIFLSTANHNPSDKHETIRHIDEVLTGQIKERENAEDEYQTSPKKVLENA